MIKNKKILMFVFFTIVSAVAFSALAYAETVSGHIEYKYNGSVIVNNDWTFDTETGVLTIKSVKSSGWNECGTGQKSYDKYGGWSKYNSQIKKVVLDGNFRKISNNAFKNCHNLEELVITDNIQQIDQDAFNGCTSLHTISVKEYIRVEGMADLRNIAVMKPRILKGTNIKSVFTSNSADGEINEEAFPVTLTEMYGSKDSVYEAYAKENNIPYVVMDYLVSVDVISEDNNFQSFAVPYGMRLYDYNISGDGAAVCIFEDEACTKAFDYEKNITEPLKLYTKKILFFEGWSVRFKDYNGLRAVFRYDTEILDSNDHVEIVKVGAIAGKQKYALNEFTIDTEGTNISVVYENGQKIGATLGLPVDGKVLFAISAIGFEGSEEEFCQRAMENIVFRGFVIIRDKRTGDEYTYYTDAIGSTLAYVSKQYLKSNAAAELTDDAKAFIQKSVDATAGKGEDVRYDKETLMELLTEIYNDNGKLLVGQEINTKETATNVIDAYLEASGESPSILGMDLACYGARLMTCTLEYRTEFLKSLIDYCRDGGIITASSHFENPTGSGLTCRGYLGKEDAWEALLTEGTDLNRAFKRELSVDAAFLRELSNNDIPILWRPFHEMNGSWFWWCIRQKNNYLVDSRNFQEMWKYVYEYYENDLGLTNLIWVYSPNNDTGKLVDVEYCYPGDEYVDMTGLDWYSGGEFEIGSSEGAYLRMMDYGMPTAITEYGGTSGELDSIQTWEDIQKMYENGMKLTYLLTWTSQHSFPVRGKVDELMAKPDILSLTEVFSMFKAKEMK